MAMIEERDEERDDRQSLLAAAKDIALAPLRIATSPLLLRTYLRTALLFITSSILLALAVVAYTSFYYTYIPIRGLSVPIYLQYDHVPHVSPPPPSSPPNTSPADTNALAVRPPRHPYGIATLHGIVSRQKYDVVVDMRVPRSARNLDAGNWMLGVDIRGSTTVGRGVKGVLGWEEEWDVEDYTLGPSAGTVKEKVGNKNSDMGTGADTGSGAEKPLVLARSRRPALLVYRSWATETAHRFLRLPLYVLGFGTESETLTIHMMEGVEFAAGSSCNIPSSLKLEVRGKTPVEVYSVTVRFRARLEGLRWLMYTHWIASALVFIGAFWAVEMGVVLGTWVILSFCLAGPSEDENHDTVKRENGAVKEERADSVPASPLSDASRTFPTLSSQRPLKYASPSESKYEGRRIKDERGDTPRLDDVPMKTEEADDEEDDDFLLDEAGLGRDSGLGTSMESTVERVGVARRRSGGGGRKRER